MAPCHRLTRAVEVAIDSICRGDNGRAGGTVSPPGLGLGVDGGLGLGVDGGLGLGVDGGLGLGVRAADAVHDVAEYSSHLVDLGARGVDADELDVIADRG